jgi:NAD(P)-dependent dehydrogenase (short-subunit alcohol dehydrogenase family)
MHVLVTGTSSGIGLSAAVALAADGHRVTASMRDPVRMVALLAAATAAGVELDVVPLDVTDPGSVAEALATAETGAGPVEVLVNNAGAATVGTLEQLSEDELAACMDLNFTGAVRMMQAVLPGMRERGAGRIINVTSVGGIVGQPFNDAYCAAKFALEGLSESLAPVARRFGVHVSVLEPGPVATEFVATAGSTIGSWAADPDDPYAELFGAYIGRTGDTFADAQTADDVARVIVDMVRDPAPAFRWQSSDGARAFVEPKLADPTGERIVGMTSDWI